MHTKSILSIETRPLVQESPFITLLKSLKNLETNDKETLEKYREIATKIATRSIATHKQNELQGETVEELIWYIDHITGQNSTLARFSYSVLEESSGVTKAMEDDFFELFSKPNPSFSQAKQKRLLTFLMKYPLWVEKIDTNNNTPFLLSVKNFSDCDEDFLLMKFLLERWSRAIFIANKETQDPFSEAARFVKHEEAHTVFSNYYCTSATKQ